MGYFSSLARHTGVAPLSGASRAAPPIHGIEVDSTRFAEALAPPASLAPHVVAQQPTAPAPSSPGPPSPVLRSPAPAARAPAPPLREILVEIPAPPRVEVREHVIEVPAPLPGEDLTPPFGAATAEPSPSPSPSPPIAAVRIGQPEPHKEPPRERRLPTFADVRAWVARPLLEAAQAPLAGAPAVEASPLHTLHSARALAAPAPAPGREENYKLEIGTIRIVMDEPAAPAPPRPAAPAPSAPAWSHPSRYYLRP